MSFKLSGQCAENYYGPQCAIFCSEVAGVSTCDSDGNNIVCVDPEGDPLNRTTVRVCHYSAKIYNATHVCQCLNVYTFSLAPEIYYMILTPSHALYSWIEAQLYS